ncbi:hypothetical protein LCGC14_1316410 [marine sediment metagenome]|uniref:Uncharacterized protein n=1 Tax=marine sediment metagenome TaxID=412755 RepID=A0A0F9N1M1_9ZZZZ
MPKPKKMRKTQSKPKNAEKRASPASIPIAAVPHLFNEKILEWQEAQFKALKAIHEKLDEILVVLKEE